VNRNNHEDLRYMELLRFVKNINPKSIEWTGGGDPTQYEYITDAIQHFHSKGIPQGFITNGIDLVKKIGVFVDCLKWIRISLNSLDYVDDIEIPTNIQTLGFSYVMNQKTDSRVLDRVKKYTEKYKPKYVRIVQDCQTTPYILNTVNEVNMREVSKWGSPYFYQAKVFSQPKRCWWGHFKPFLLHDGYIYPCSSVVLNDSAEKSFHEKFRWTTMDQFVKMSKESAIPYDCKSCTNCVFGGQNELVEAFLNSEMEEFV
jgi:hypothetical protein